MLSTQEALGRQEKALQAHFLKDVTLKKKAGARGRSCPRTFTADGQDGEKSCVSLSRPPHRPSCRTTLRTFRNGEVIFLKSAMSETCT